MTSGKKKAPNPAKKLIDPLSPSPTETGTTRSNRPYQVGHDGRQGRERDKEPKDLDPKKDTRKPPPTFADVAALHLEQLSVSDNPGDVNVNPNDIMEDTSYIFQHDDPSLNGFNQLSF